MAEKKKNIKPLIILGVVLVAALIGFLVYDEVKTANYKKELNLAIQNTYDLESGSCVGQTYNYQKENPEEKSEAVRQANFVRTDDGLIFHESTGNEDGSALVSDVFVKPGIFLSGRRCKMGAHRNRQELKYPSIQHGNHLPFD